MLCYWKPHVVILKVKVAQLERYVSTSKDIHVHFFRQVYGLLRMHSWDSRVVWRGSKMAILG